MPAKLHPIALSQQHELQTLVESRRAFTLVNAELNIFETYKDAYRVPLTFSDFVLTSMVRGKKVMHLPNKDPFDYVPGESVIVPANQTMVIDFPEAREDSPSQCIALAIDQDFIVKTLQYLDQHYNSDPDTRASWKFSCNRYHFENDQEISLLIDKMISICSSESRVKNIYADLSLKELLVRLIQSQHLAQAADEALTHTNQSRSHAVLSYINEHLDYKINIDELSRYVYMNRTSFFNWFKEQFGVPPLEYINRKRLHQAKNMLATGSFSVGDTAYQCGFDDVNYFVRLFKKMEGVTPGRYKGEMGREK